MRATLLPEGDLPMKPFGGDVVMPVRFDDGADGREGGGASCVFVEFEGVLFPIVEFVITLALR
jgi:hypothetical protein